MLKGAKASFRQPFVLVMESVARDELAVLNAASAVTGALVGTCGLRSGRLVATGEHGHAHHLAGAVRE
jgi:hypothetical protein